MSTAKRASRRIRRNRACFTIESDLKELFRLSSTLDPDRSRLEAEQEEILRRRVLRQLRSKEVQETLLNVCIRMLWDQHLSSSRVESRELEITRLAKLLHEAQEETLKERVRVFEKLMGS